MALDEKDEHVKEVYAHAGLALYFAQVLEHSVVNAMVIARLPEHGTVTRAEIASFEAEQFDKTLGQMLKTLRRYVAVPAALDLLLKDALQKRNTLAHQFFRTFAERFMTEAGREEMLSWLRSAQATFHGAADQLDDVVQPLALKYGITDEVVAGILAKIPTDLE